MKFATISAFLIAASAITGAAWAHGHGPGTIDTNRDGKITLEESRAAAAALFAKIDSNGDGVVTLAEAEAARAKRGTKFEEHAEARKEAHDPFTHADANQDGKVTKAEAQALVDSFFAKMDKNGDGVLTQDELPGRGRRGEGERHGCGPKKGAKDSAA